MPKIIFTSRYLRDAPTAQLENYVRYISTREGVEKIDESKRNLPATRNQQQLIQQLIRDIPASKDMLEYADFLLRPTIGNASEFISCALEQNLDLIAKRENYVDYIANRPPCGESGRAWVVHGRRKASGSFQSTAGSHSSQGSGLDSCGIPAARRCGKARL